MSNISCLPLGGQDERGKNCFIIKINNDIFVFDVGVKIPINGKLGVNMITPDFDYLANNANNVRGIFIGYPYSNNYAALPFLLKKINPNTPIYCSDVAKVIIETYYEKSTLKLNKPNINVVNEYNKLVFNNTTIIPFKICNSILNSLGWIIKTDDGSIIYLDDFMINNDKTLIFHDHIEKINHITNNKNLALIASTGNVGNYKGFTTPNHNNYQYYENIISNVNGRIFIALNDQDAYTIVNLANIAKTHKRPFCVYGSTFMNLFSYVVKNKMISPKGLMCIKISEIKNSPNAIVVISAIQDNLFKILFNIVNNQNQNITLNNTDTFILGVQLINGYEGHAARLMDELHRLDVNAYSLPRNILPMVASNEDHKYLIDLLNPKYIFPTQGYYKSIVKYQAVCTQTKVNYNNVIYLDNGEMIEINNGELNDKKTIIKLNENYVNNIGSIDVGNAVLNERKQMAEAGIIFLSIAIDVKNNKFLNYIDVESYGTLTNDEDSKKALDEIINQFKNNIYNNIVIDKIKNKIDTKETKILIKKFFVKLFEKKFNKRPIILPTIIEINER